MRTIDQLARKLPCSDLSPSHLRALTSVACEALQGAARRALRSSHGPLSSRTLSASNVSRLHWLKTE